MSVWVELQKRGLIHDQTDPEIEKHLLEGKVTFYVGVDPTGESLHIGHIIVYYIAEHLRRAGHKPLILVGGSTGLIGDPREKGERKLMELADTHINLAKLKEQVKRIFGFEDYVNNYDWTKDISLIDYLRDIGKHFNVNNMLNKDIVKRRLEDGISYTEFSYQILQALDWHYLYKNYNCTMQFGGQDQWGNLTAGCDYLRKKEPGAKVYAFTNPLILKSDGTKFGKSEGGSVWIDPNLTSPYEFYQFWINTPDADVIARLKQYTFIPLEEISKIEEEFMKSPENRLAQRTLACEITRFIHGEEALNTAMKISNALFTNVINELNEEEFLMAVKGTKEVIASREDSIVDVLVATSLAQSKREAREFISNGAISVNDTKISDEKTILSTLPSIANRYYLIRRGKKKHCLVVIG